MDHALPLSTTSRLTPAPPPTPGESRPTVALIGAAGVVATVTHARLRHDYLVTGLDVCTRSAEGTRPWWTTGSITDEAAVADVVQGATYVIVAATGAKSGWQGLRDVEITGTKVVYEAAAAAGVRRVVLVSSNHVSGMAEVDGWEKGSIRTADPADPPRPDGVYACSKVFAESVARAHAEIHGLRTSVLRLGAMRLTDDPDKASDGPWPAGMTEASYRSRMQAVWMYHHDWEALLRQELASVETFRLRYASTPSPASPWTQNVLTWSR